MVRTLRDEPGQRMRWVLVALLLLVALTVVATAREIVITSSSDGDSGTLRTALQIARPGDVITFDQEVFPPKDPATIYPRSELPQIHCGNLTIDASNAGVIIDGSNVPGDWNNGLQVYSSYNTVMGLQIVAFAGSGIVVAQGTHNTIGGDRSTGSGPIGQGNLASGNAIGINLCDVNTHDNVILGNLVGVAVDAITPWGNTVFGVFIEDNVHDNVIGPKNVIANNEQGIAIAGAGAVRNRITQNSIRDNGAGISLWSGGNSNIDAPVIMDFSVEVGSLSGLACAGCLVELFSDSVSEDSIYEGTSQADESGWFSFSGETLLESESLTATATDPQGNTSPYSTPTRGTGVGRILQTSNDGSKHLLVTYPSSELADNRLGGMWNGLWQFDDQQDWEETFRYVILELGLKRARLTINSLEQVTGEYVEDMSQPEMSVISIHDALFSMVANAGVQITYTLTFWDKEGPHTEEVLSGPRFQTEDQIARYLEFAQFMVGHFKDRVQRFEIWNESNLSIPGQAIALEDYLELTRRAIPVIRAASPAAMIQIGGTTGLREAESREYLFSILTSDIMSSIDVVSWHPLYGESPANEAAYYYAYPSIVREIRNTAEAHGFTGEYEADEITWWTLGEVNDQPWRYSTLHAAKYYARGILTNLGLDCAVVMGGIGGRPDVRPAIQNLCTVMAGHEAIDIPVDIDIETEGPVAYCAFRYPNGDRMLAVWTDGIAQDEDPGVPTTITFPGLTAATVTGIDVVQGFEQELVFETEGDSTIIRDLLVKDYPTLIRLSNVMTSPDYVETVGDGFHRLGDVNAVPSSSGGDSDRDGDGVPDDEDYCPDWPGSKEANGC